MAIQKQKGKKKHWYSIYAPKEFKNVEIGETTVSDPKQIIGKTLSLNLGLLSGQMRKQNVKISFLVNKIVEGKANTEIIEYKLSSAYAKRVVRKGKTKIEESFIIETKDGIKCRVKPLAITRNKITSSTSAPLRKELRSFLINKSKKQSYEDLFHSLIVNEAQKDLKNNLSKVYPISFVEFKTVKKLTK